MLDIRPLRDRVATDRPDQLNELIRKHTIAAVVCMTASLEPQQQALLDTIYWRGGTLRAWARSATISPATASRIHRAALQRLRELLAKAGVTSIPR